MFKLLAQSGIRRKLAPTAHKPFASLAAAVTFGKAHFRALPWSVARESDKDDAPLIPVQKPAPSIADKFAIAS